MKKSLIIRLTVLLLMSFAGTTYATEGPSQQVDFPFICQVPVTSTSPFHLYGTPEHLDMVFTIANVTNIDTGVNVLVSSLQSAAIQGESLQLSSYGVASETCIGWISKMSSTTQKKLIQTIDGTQYYVGYIEYDVAAESGASLIGWGEIETLSTSITFGFPSPHFNTNLYTDAGFNGVPNFNTNVNAATNDVSGSAWLIYTNQTLMPRYNIANSSVSTYDWWIIMTASDAGTCQRIMEGFICNDNEQCVSENILIPYQVNIVNVADILPPILSTTFPYAGFGTFEVVLTGTSAGGNPCGNAGNTRYLGWSYQHTLGSGGLETALIFPMHIQVTIAP